MICLWNHPFLDIYEMFLMWGEVWKCSQSKKRDADGIGVGYGSGSVHVPFGKQNGGISSADKTELGKPNHSSLFGIFYIHSGIGPFFNSVKGNKIAYAQNSGSANSVVSLANCFQDLHGSLTVRMLYCDAFGGTREWVLFCFVLFSSQEWLGALSLYIV